VEVSIAQRRGGPASPASIASALADSFMVVPFNVWYHSLQRIAAQLQPSDRLKLQQVRHTRSVPTITLQRNTYNAACSCRSRAGLLCSHSDALVANDNFSARYDLDRFQGNFSHPEHALAGQSYVGKIIVLNTAKGGVATAWMLYEMVSRGMAPAALLLNTANTILAQGAALANLPLCDRFEAGDITTLINTGDTVQVDPQHGVVTITSR
jgi:predicted aconitase with swiveling domain